MNFGDYFYYAGGALRWKVQLSSRGLVGSVAGGPSSRGYWCVTINKKKYFVHRVVWELLNGTIPEDVVVDHINRIRDDNRIENLRLATKQENQINSVYSCGKLKPRGVHYSIHAKKYRAQTQYFGRTVHIGYYNTELEASTAYNNYLKEMFNEFVPDSLSG